MKKFIQSFLLPLIGCIIIAFTAVSISRENQMIDKALNDRLAKCQTAECKAKVQKEIDDRKADDDLTMMFLMMSSHH